MDAQPLILAILREAQHRGVAPLLRTTLIKYLYLLDVYTAEESQGNPISNLDWKFLHFGPFSPQAAQALDKLVVSGTILMHQQESGTADKEFMLYNLPQSQKVQDLRGIGLPGFIQTRIHADMKRYSKDLPRLLNFVYFNTTPMENASPGNTLDFSNCRKIQPEDIKPVGMQKLRPKAIKKGRNKLRELIKSRKAQADVPQGPLDEAYFSALDMLNGSPVETGLAGKAKLKV